MLRATTVCTFSSSQLPRVLREWCVLYILTWKCASRHNGVHVFTTSTSKSGLREPGLTFDCDMCFDHNGVQFFLHPARWLRTRRFSEPTFRPSGDTNHWKHILFRDFSTFSRACIFFPLTLSSDSFSSLIFFLLLFSSLLFTSLHFTSLLFSSLL